MKTTHDATSAECRIYTFKEGLLSRVAHDLELEVQRFTLAIDDDPLSVDARFDPTSIRVLTPLSASDRGTIEATMLKEVLEARRYPEVRFLSRSVAKLGAGYRIEGTLELHGRSRALTIDTRLDGQRQRAEVKLHQPDYGIEPYSAMLGTLRIKPDVRVVVRLQAPVPGD